MQINIQSSEVIKNYFSKIKSQLALKKIFCVKYASLGNFIIRIECYTPEIIPHIEKQLHCLLNFTPSKYDFTLIVFKEDNLSEFAKFLDSQFDTKSNLRLRVETLCNKNRFPSITITNNNLLKTPIIDINGFNGTINGLDIEEKKFYFSSYDYSTEEFSKLGHIFVQPFYKILTTTQQNKYLIHGASFGLKNKGVLLCARGNKGKSTLTINSLLHGFDFVSDDYQILEPSENKLIANPIYSIITLAPPMYDKMYNALKGKFVSTNWNKTKYVINIASYEKQIKQNYLLELCLLPIITSQIKPDISLCTPQEKGKAIVQLIHSTLMQMNDLSNSILIQHLFKLFVSMPFFKFSLSPDIEENSIYLKNFLNSHKSIRENIILDRTLIDIDSNCAYFLDTKEYKFYSMNEFATDIYLNLKKGVCVDAIEFYLTKEAKFSKIPKVDFKKLIDFLKEKQILDLNEIKGDNNHFEISNKSAQKCHFKLSIQSYDEQINNSESEKK